MGHPERISALSCHEIGEIRALSQRESGIEPVPKDSIHCSIRFLAAVMP